VAKNKESLLFNRIKTALKTAYLLRIETSTARGVADVFCIYKRRSFWVELKANDSSQRALKIYSVEARRLHLLHQCTDTAGGLVEAFNFMHDHALNNHG
jgi:hypothetical protein